MKTAFFRILMGILALSLCFGLVSCQPTPDENDGTDTTGSDATDATDATEEGTTEEATTEEMTTEEATTEEETTEEATTEAPPAIENVACKLANGAEVIKVIGRSSTVGTGISCDFTASGIEFNAYVEGDLKLKVTTAKTSYTSVATAYFTVIIDGVRSETRFKATPGTTTLTIASFAEGGVHNVKVLKQTETMNAICVLEELSFTGYFCEPEGNKSVFIEFIGDSITSGYGNLCANGTSDPGNALNQDGTQSFAFIAANTVGADYSMVSASGVGLTAGYREFTVETLFNRASYYRNNTTYTPTRTPDIVVINIGTNDESKGADSDQFQKKATEFLQMLRTTYGENVKIVVVYNMMKAGMGSQWNRAMSALGGEDAGFYLYKGARNTAGGNGHPDLATQKSVGEGLAAFLIEKGLVAPIAAS